MSGHGRSYDEYRIVPRDGGKPVRHARATTIAGTLDDRDALEKWGKRMVALGLVARPDLLSLVSVTPASEKGTLNDICANATEAAAASAGANQGTALHKLTERVDAGEPVIVPPRMQADLDAYTGALKAHGIEILPDYIERVCVCGSLEEPIAGTVDRFVRWSGEPHVADLKTGASLHFAWRKIAIQLSIYANADSLYDRDTDTHDDVPAVNRERGIVFHLPVGRAKCDVYLVDLVAGWEAAAQSVGARKWRKRNDLATRLDVAEQRAA